jgi:hypothetical protein
MTEADGTSTRSNRLSVVVIRLLKGVVHRDDDLALWGDLLDLQNRLRDHVGVLGLDLFLDEAEGYAFLKSVPPPEEGGEAIPRLVARRQLSYPVSLLLALLRRKLAEADASGGDLRLVVSLDDLVEMVRTFLPERRDEAKVVDRIGEHARKIADLGFLRPLKGGGSAKEQRYEVRRILKAFVDAQWLSDFDARLEAYRTAGTVGREGGDDA